MHAHSWLSLVLFVCHRQEREKRMHSYILSLNKMADVRKVPKMSIFLHSLMLIENLPRMFPKGHTKFQPEQSNSEGGVLGQTNRQIDRWKILVRSIAELVWNT